MRIDFKLELYLIKIISQKNKCRKKRKKRKKRKIKKANSENLEFSVKLYWKASKSCCEKRSYKIWTLGKGNKN